MPRARRGWSWTRGPCASTFCWVGRVASASRRGLRAPLLPSTRCHVRLTRPGCSSRAGVHDSGKTTLQRSLQLSFGLFTSHASRELLSPEVRDSILASAATLSRRALEELGSTLDLAFTELFRNLRARCANGLTLAVVESLRSVARNPELVERLVACGVLPPDPLFLDDMVATANRALRADYQPSNADILRYHWETLGVQSSNIGVPDAIFRVHDAGGRLAERRKWARALDDHPDAAIIYVVALDGMYLRAEETEDKTESAPAAAGGGSGTDVVSAVAEPSTAPRPHRTMFDDSLQAFAEVCTWRERLRGRSLMVVLNRLDRFQLAFKKDLAGIFASVVGSEAKENEAQAIQLVEARFRAVLAEKGRGGEDTAFVVATAVDTTKPSPLLPFMQPRKAVAVGSATSGTLRAANGTEPLLSKSAGGLSRQSSSPLAPGEAAAAASTSPATAASAGTPVQPDGASHGVKIDH